MKDEDKSLVEQAQLIKSINENWPAHQASITLTARLTHAKYVALVAQGFTEFQALYLVKA